MRSAGMNPVGRRSRREVFPSGSSRSEDEPETNARVLGARMAAGFW